MHYTLVNAADLVETVRVFSLLQDFLNKGVVTERFDRGQPSAKLQLLLCMPRITTGQSQANFLGVYAVPLQLILISQCFYGDIKDSINHKEFASYL